MSPLFHNVFQRIKNAYEDYEKCYQCKLKSSNVTSYYTPRQIKLECLSKKEKKRNEF